MIPLLWWRWENGRSFCEPRTSRGRILGASVFRGTGTSVRELGTCVRELGTSVREPGTCS